MDLSMLRPAEIVGAIAALTTVLAGGFFGIPKILSELGLNRVVQRRHLSELIDALTSKEDGLEKAHPLAIQVKFQAAFGGARASIPQGSEIRALLENHDLAMYYNVLEYAECAKFVAYSEPRKAFVPRGNRTEAELDSKRRWSFIIYCLTAMPAFALFCIPPFCFHALLFRIPLGCLLGLFAAAHAVQAKIIGRTQKLLEQTRTQAPSSVLPMKKADAPQEAPCRTDRPKPSSGTKAENVSGTFRERDLSVKMPDPGKH